MDLDIEDVVAGAVGSVIGRFILFLIAVWIGCSVGALGMVAGIIADNGTWPKGDGMWILVSPLLLFSSWAVLNIPFLIFYLVRFIRGEGDDYVTWGVVLGVESLAVMLGWGRDFVHGWLPMSVAVLVWLVVLTMAETGVWLIRQMGINRWAREMAVLRAINAQRQAEKEAEERERMGNEELR